MFTLIWQAILIVFIYMSALFILAQIKKDNSLVDVGWGIGFMLLALYSFFFFSSFYARQLLATLLTLIWGMRISTYIYMRNQGKGEDKRYQEFRKRWGQYAFVLSYLEVFMLQGFLMLLICSSVLVINRHSGPGIWWLDIIGALCWLCGFWFEAVSDMQLYLFLSKPENKGTIMQQGLWHYSRHPNYFGEMLIWCGMFIIALSVPFGWLAIISPLTIIGIFYFISIPITERQFDSNEQFQEYKKITSMIIPLPKKGV